MRWLPLLLVGLIAGRHQLVDVLAMFYANPDRARKALFYAAGGVTAAILYWLVALLTRRLPRTIALPTALACAWGMLEEGQVAICRFAAGIDRPVSAPMWRGICDSMLDLPLSTVTLCLPVVIVYLLYDGDRDG